MGDSPSRGYKTITLIASNCAKKSGRLWLFYVVFVVVVVVVVVVVALLFLFFFSGGGIGAHKTPVLRLE